MSPSRLYASGVVGAAGHSTLPDQAGGTWEGLTLTQPLTGDEKELVGCLACAMTRENSFS